MPTSARPRPRRPGRLDKVLYVPLPPPGGRADILRALTRRTPLAPGVDLAGLGASARTAGFSGADLAALVREAAVASLKARRPRPHRTSPAEVSVADSPCAVAAGRGRR